MHEMFKEGSTIDKMIEAECRTWACWGELSEQDQEEVYEGYAKIALAAYNLQDAKLRGALTEILEHEAPDLPIGTYMWWREIARKALGVKNEEKVEETKTVLA